MTLRNTVSKFEKYGYQLRKFQMKKAHHKGDALSFYKN